MERRSFLRAGAAASVLGALPRISLSQHLPYDPRPAGWRTFEVTTQVEIAKPAGTTRAWVPLPSIEGDYQKLLGDTWSGNGAMRPVREPKYGAWMLMSEWAGTEKAPALKVVSKVATRNRAAERTGRAKLDLSAARLALSPTELIPTDGLVRKTALEVTRGKGSEIERARAIYDWIVENTFRNPKTRGCGTGNILAMLETGDLSGKCADLNALYVGLARAVDLPARDIYGLRVAKSEFGYRSLGVGSYNVTRAQHCRAEVFVSAYGWIPVDPADVRKVVLEERPEPTTLADPLVPPVREKLFGAWEMNWIAYNDAHDLKLPGSDGPAVGFLMYPQAETGGTRLDSLDPDSFRYTITAREIPA